MYVYSYFVTSSMFEKNYFFCIFDGVIFGQKIKASFIRRFRKQGWDQSRTIIRNNVISFLP